MHAAKRRTLIFNSSLLVCQVTLRSPFLYFNVMIPLLILIKPKDYAAPQMSAYGTSVWTGRALQAESDDLEVIDLALLYPALERNVCVPGHHGYPRASDLILGKAQRGRSCHQITDATARPFLHLFIPARRPRRESQLLLSGSASDVGRRPSPFRLRPS